MRVIIVGGVAGGASCAARLRRLDEKADILMVERGPYVSYANCGLPYHVGGSIEKESSLLVATEQTFREQFAIDCRTRCEVIGISAEAKAVELKNHVTGEVTIELQHPSVAAPEAQRTEQFALTVTGGKPPAGLVDALLARIREQEGKFEWTWMAKGPPPMPVPWIGVAAVVVVLLAAAAWWLARGRGGKPSGA